MTRKYTKTTLVVSVHPEGDNPIYSESATHVCVEDESGGPFITLKQSHSNIQPGEVRLDFEEFKSVIEAVEFLSNQEGVKYVD